jgi:hypothetical protein
MQSKRDKSSIVTFRNHIVHLFYGYNLISNFNYLYVSEVQPRDKTVTRYLYLGNTTLNAGVIYE